MNESLFCGIFQPYAEVAYFFKNDINNQSEFINTNVHLFIFVSF